jgi:hydrogenase nickel incorporation protein HypA/HybF
MHELALIENVINAVKNSALENNITRIDKIVLVVGRFANAIPESLEFAFEAIKKTEPLFTEAVLELKETPVECKCHQCGECFKLEGRLRFVCPLCQGNDIEITGGRELYIEYYEGDDNDGTGESG